jgi:tetratricopeptide (TPR) repeat protein
MRRAVSIIIFGAAVLAGCGKPTPEEYWSRAAQARQSALKEMDTVRHEGAGVKLFEPAIENYTALLREYPATPQAEQALFALASLYNDYTGEYQKAIESFGQYVERYPDRAKTPVAMFLIGYIYNNQLGNLDSARVAYERFLQRYPDHEMAESARFELNSLGKSPEELLPPDQPKKAGKTVAKNSAVS